MSTSLSSMRLRPAAFPPSISDYICNACQRRGVATFRRTRKALRVPGSTSSSTTESQDYIIFNPPSSAPNIYHTPLKFLPASDKRKALLSNPPPQPTAPPSSKQPLTTLAAIAAERQSGSARPLPDLVHSVREKRNHMTQEDIDEIRRLYDSDPHKWTRHRLAVKFDCSKFFITLCTEGSPRAPEMKAEHEMRMEAAKSRMGPRKLRAWEDRIERKKLWGLA